MADTFQHASNWTWLDLFATLFDRTPSADGTLEVQDDLHPERWGEPLQPLPSIAPLPFDALADAVDIADYRQRKRTKAQKRGRAHGTRKLERVRGIWLHQPAALLRAPDRYLSVPVHRAAVGGIAVLLHPFRAYMYAAHAANRTTINYEVEARAAGIAGNARTFWRSKREKKAGRDYGDLVHEASDETLKTCRRLIRYDIEEVARQGGEIEYIGGHRQSHKSRVGDPGSRIWAEVGEWAIREFGISRGPIFGSGRKLPTSWTGVGAEPYSWRVKGF